MTCYFPLDGFRAKSPGPNGKRGIVFVRKHGYEDLPMQVPCGQCIGCRLEKSRQWALRCTHEASLHKNNCFITLTYNSQHLPDDLSLNLRHFQLFMKRLRKKYGQSIRFFHCGEYGELNNRPHYHAILFNHDFTDRIHFKTHNDIPYYTSKELDELWTDHETGQQMGFCVVGDVTFESAAYVARYCMKKETGPRSHELYLRIDDDTGEIFYLKKEYATMSRGGKTGLGGIGAGWYKKWTSDIYPSDFIIRDGQKMKPPKFYDNMFEKENEKQYRRIKGNRIRQALKKTDDNTPERLAVRAEVQRLTALRLKRGMENEK